MKPLTIIIFGFVLSSRILTEFFSFLSPLGNPTYFLLGMFSVYLSIKSKIGMFLIVFAFDMIVIIRNIGFLEASFNSYIKSTEIIEIHAITSTYFIWLLSIIFIVFFNGIWSFILGYHMRKKHIIGL